MKEVKEKSVIAFLFDIAFCRMATFRRLRGDAAPLLVENLPGEPSSPTIEK